MSARRFNGRLRGVHRAVGRMKLRSSCPVCDAERLETVTNRTNVPVHQNKLYNTAQEAREAIRGDLHVVTCLTCGFVFNAAFDLSLMCYEEGYDNDQTHSPAFSEHVERLADRLLNEENVRNSRIVEVGSGKGTFLHALVAADTGNTGWGFDPAYRGPATTLDGRVRYVRSFYDSGYTSLTPDVVICRHVIEHVPEPVALLREIREASPKARVFLETPDVEWILRNEVVWDLFYEHCSYFSAHSFATAFERAGYEDVKNSLLFGDQYLWAQATAGMGRGVDVAAEPGKIARLVENYARAEGQILARWHDTIQSARSSGAVALWGAGAKGVTSASLFDPQTQLISCVVDLNPAKQGRFIGGTGHSIVSPSALKTLGVSSIVVMNPNYRTEVEQLLSRERISVDVIIDPAQQSRR